jgi:hypothetical protein
LCRHVQGQAVLLGLFDPEHDGADASSTAVRT